MANFTCPHCTSSITAPDIPGEYTCPNCNNRFTVEERLTSGVENTATPGGRIRERYRDGERFTLFLVDH